MRAHHLAIVLACSMAACSPAGPADERPSGRAAWEEHDRCDASRRRIEACPRGTGARKRRRDDCAMFDRIARSLHPDYPRCIEPATSRPAD